MTTLEIIPFTLGPAMTNAYLVADSETKEAAVIDPAWDGHVILSEAENHDLVIIGSTMDPLIAQVTRDSISHAVAQKCQQPLIMVKASSRIKSWLRRLI